jgi:hypothetical protein
MQPQDTTTTTAAIMPDEKALETDRARRWLEAAVVAAGARVTWSETHFLPPPEGEVLIELAGRAYYIHIGSAERE